MDFQHLLFQNWGLWLRPVNHFSRLTVFWGCRIGWILAQACLLLAFCTTVSFVAYVIAYWLWVPRPAFELPLHFCYHREDSAELFGVPIKHTEGLLQDLPTRFPESIADLRDGMAFGGWQRGIYTSRCVV